MKDNSTKEANDINKAIWTSIKPRRGKKICSILNPLLNQLGLPKLTTKEVHQIKSVNFRKNK